MSTIDKLLFKFSRRWEPPRSQEILLHCVLLSNSLLVCQYFWKPSRWSKLNFFSSEKTTFCHSLALMVWYWWSYFSHSSLCFIVNLKRWILFLCLFFSLFKCLLIVLVLQGASTRDFNSLCWRSFLFYLRTILLLNCGDNSSGLPDVFLVPYSFELFKKLQITVLLRPKAFKISLRHFPTVFRAVISLFSNSDNLVLVVIYVFSISSITVAIAFILRTPYMIHFSIELSYLFFGFYWWSFEDGLIFLSRSIYI